MTYQYSVALRNSKLNAISTQLGATSTLKIFSGAEPVNCAAADPAGLLATMSLPAAPFNAASGGQMTLAGTWSTTASATGTAASFRIYDSSSNCTIQGNVTTDLVLNTTNIAAIGQTIQVVTFTVTAGNA